MTISFGIGFVGPTLQDRNGIVTFGTHMDILNGLGM